MYKGHYRIILGKEEIDKIEKMLREKWHVEDLNIIHCLVYWELSFLTDDYKKAYKMFEIIKRYKGTVLDHQIKKVE
jgi:hypothetical protein